MRLKAVAAFFVVGAVGGCGSERTGPEVVEPRATIGDFVGFWVNEDPNTRSLPQLNIRVATDTVFVHIWGSCHPTYCDWGETTTDVADAADGVLEVFWDHHFATRNQFLTLLADGRLEVLTETDFTDADGRQDFADTQRFIRS